MEETKARADAETADRKKVLIVDDSRAIRAIIRRALECEELGELHIETACDGTEALDRIDSFRPDLVLADWHMPGVSGIEMLQTLRQSGHADIAVGFVTTETASECLMQAHSNGALFVLNKPFDDGALRRAVAQGLQRRASPAPALTAETPGAQAIESLAQLQQSMSAHLGMRGFELDRQDGGGSAEWLQQQGTRLIALYGSAGRKGVYAVGLLDLPACCLLGGSSGGEIQAALRQGRPAARQVEQASRFMRAVTPLLKKRTPSDAPALSAARLSSQPFDKLAQLLQQNHGRSDFLLRLPATGGQGRLSFMLA
ncbi:response regulator [Roseateles violae]|uniref:Response regulator n=1 Tax=Roseateles violae TaxID=3058042 RepID=A0ABT8DV51_9BURK|nr:response regulator [Pelomonas sp. PFR6]MDN3920252.1 response regulator [Pelomonas sp. PFR6]